MNRKQILAAIEGHRRQYKPGFHAEILYIRGYRIWWLVYKAGGSCRIELSEYGVN